MSALLSLIAQGGFGNGHMGGWGWLAIAAMVVMMGGVGWMMERLRTIEDARR